MPKSASTVPTYQFGPFRLEVGERRLLNDGRAMPLRRRCSTRCRVLVEHAGRLLTKHEIDGEHLARHGGRREQPQSQHLDPAARARRKATGQSYIETVPRVGYRFVAT